MFNTTYFICGPSDSIVSKDAGMGSNPRLLRLWHWQPDAYSHSILDLIHCSYPSCVEWLNPFFFIIHFLFLIPFPFLFPFNFLFLTISLQKILCLFYTLISTSMLNLLFSCFLLPTFNISFCLFLPCTVYSLYSLYTSFRLYKKQWTHLVNFLQSSKFNSDQRIRTTEFPDRSAISNTFTFKKIWRLFEKQFAV